jgi:uroporphyrinogen III methyltransferase / synthase
MTDGLDSRDRDAAPLSGRSVVVTRAADQAPGLAAPLEALGAEVLIMPVIAVVPPRDWSVADSAIERLGTYDWIVLTSVNGVDAFGERLHFHGLRVTDLACMRVAAVGSSTAARLREIGVEPAIVPERFRAEGLVDALSGIGPDAGRRVLVPRAEEAREVLPDDLRALGFEVDVVPVYRVVTASPPADVLERVATGEVSAVVFASGGTARRFVEVLGNAGVDAPAALVAPVVVSIGPVTTEALHELGIAVDEEAAEPTATAVVRAIVDRFTGARR